MQRFFNEVTHLLSNGISLAVATIFDQAGSAPRTVGAKMLVKSDGSIYGTVGGGKLEAEACRLAAEVLRTRTPLTWKFDLKPSDAAGMGMVCGGNGELLIEFLDANDAENLAIYREIGESVARRQPAWLITSLGTGVQNRGIRQQCLVKQDRTLIGHLDCNPELLAKLIQGPAKITIHSEALPDQRLLVEPIRHGGTVFLFGAGHVAQKTAVVAESVGFKTVVLDDRQEYANAERFPASEIILLRSLAEPLPDLELNQDSYLVIVTRGHLHDLTLLAAMLSKEVAYIGMIGSKSKRQMVYQTLTAEYGYTEADLARVFSPIGLDILAETPEEIAVSIVAELIKVRAEREKHSGCSGFTIKDAPSKCC